MAAGNAGNWGLAQNTLCVERVCLESKEKGIFIIGGPNGAGKTTVARKFLPQVILGVPSFPYTLSNTRMGMGR